MKCYNCGCRLSEKDFCTACGVDVTVYKRIIATSNQYYNEALEKANVRDLSGAIGSLKQCLRFNKSHVDARNLLGLVYFEMGETASALSEWVISINLKNKKNIADDYIQMIQSNPTKLDALNQTIKKYNQALAYAYQDSQDLAVIQLKKVLSINPKLVQGYQLLALLYINNEEWERAARTLDKAAKIDTNNTLTLRYKKEIQRALENKEDVAPVAGKKKHTKAVADDVITYQSGNETIIQPLNTKESFGFSSIANIGVGLLVGCLIMWFLVLPARIQSEQARINSQTGGYAEQISARDATISDLEQRQEALQAENTRLLEEIEGLTGDEGAVQSYDYLLQAVEAYMNDSADVMTIMDYLGRIDTAYLDTASQAFQNLYKQIYEDISARAADEYYESGMSAYNSGNFANAITDLTRAWDLDNSNFNALYNLANAYRRSDNTAKADELYKELIGLEPGNTMVNNALGNMSDEAREAMEEAEGRSGGNSGRDTGDRDTGNDAGADTGGNGTDTGAGTGGEATPPAETPDQQVPPAVTTPVAPIIDPATGLLIDPATGLPVVQ